jgi:hypothetical protein
MSEPMCVENSSADGAELEGLRNRLFLLEEEVIELKKDKKRLKRMIAAQVKKIASLSNLNEVYRRMLDTLKINEK